MNHHAHCGASPYAVLCAIALSSCSGAEHHLRQERDRDLASLEQRVAEKDREIERLKQELQRLAKDVFVPDHPQPLPEYSGTVTAVSDELCVIAVAQNAAGEGGDIQSAMDRMPLRFAIYDETGYKAEVLAFKFEATSSALLCRLIYTKGTLRIAVGDQAGTRP